MTGGKESKRGINAQRYSKYNENNFHWKELEKPIWDLTFHYVLENLKDIKKDIGRLRVLEFGCGDGKFSLYLHTKGFDEGNIAAIDIDIDLIHMAKKNLSSSTFICADCSTKIIEASTKFDFIMSSMLFHYLSEKQLRSTLKISLDLLQDNGQLWALIPNPADVFLDNRDQIGSYYNSKKVNAKTPWGDKVEIYHRTKKDYFEIIEDSGFKVWLDGDSGPIFYGNVPEEKMDSYLIIPRRYTLMMGKASIGVYPML